MKRWGVLALAGAALVLVGPLAIADQTVTSKPATAGQSTVTLRYDPVSGLVTITVTSDPPGAKIVEVKRRTGSRPWRNFSNQDSHDDAGVFVMPDTYLESDDGKQPVQYKVKIKKGTNCYWVTFTIHPDGSGDPARENTEIDEPEVEGPVGC